ncbi:probable xyloglucan endotransglucosylase hydrolase 30 [Olea europaea subsp. europaea]|uniref:Probable xyloglucan endotransglucosylase hydrolase 30 n=1 Tax=Olea europaea subsp. europaea TaxID=158383 RepID=A0A8S0SHW1_OLEEU|nr:probable xyloglucan endotransglucosylase hydrolase 30 [Olea europaea subsp. europaea]
MLYTTTVFNRTTLRFDEAYSPLLSDFNIQRLPDDKSVRLLLNRFSGSGIISSDYYKYGFFSASIKLPAENTAGIVVAFYTSNVDTFEKNRDEIDIEFMGNVKGKRWRFQTNMYGNGSTSRGKEERYRLWFDPSKDSHCYSILWTPKNIM